jgi:hypothetical protein
MERKRLDPQTKLGGLRDLTIEEFWSWAYSDLLSNGNRSVLAEFIVAEALGVTDCPRVEWNAFDLSYRGKKIEVKCAGYVQSWAQSSPSKIRFDIAKKRGWCPETNTYGSKPARAADCYVFCLFEERNPVKSPDVLNLEAWRFYVARTSDIDRKFPVAKSIGLTALLSASRPIPFCDLREQIDAALGLVDPRSFGGASATGCARDAVLDGSAAPIHAHCREEIRIVRLPGSGDETT